MSKLLILVNSDIHVRVCTMYIKWFTVYTFSPLIQIFAS